MLQRSANVHYQCPLQRLKLEELISYLEMPEFELMDLDFQEVCVKF